MTIHPDFREFLELLNKHEVHYLVIGGYAVVAHGYVRATGDIDIWVSNTNENAERVICVLAEFGFSHSGLSAKDFEKEDLIFQLGYPPVRIDILTTPEGVDFEECFPKRFLYHLSPNFTINIIDLDSLKKSKRAAGRSKDLDDLQNLA